jgi:hypothetical protein
VIVAVTKSRIYHFLYTKKCVFRNQAFKDGTVQRQFVDMVQETAQRVSALPVTPRAVAVFNVAKKEGLSKLLSAGNAVVSQVTKSKSSKAGAWLSIGAAAAGTLMKVAQDRGMGSCVLLSKFFISCLFLLFHLFQRDNACRLQT